MVVLYKIRCKRNWYFLHHCWLGAVGMHAKGQTSLGLALVSHKIHHNELV